VAVARRPPASLTNRAPALEISGFFRAIYGGRGEQCVACVHFVASHFVASPAGRAIPRWGSRRTDKVDRRNRHQSRVPRRIRPRLSCRTRRYLPLLTLRTRAAVRYPPTNASARSSAVYRDYLYKRAPLPLVFPIGREIDCHPPLPPGSDFFTPFPAKRKSARFAVSSVHRNSTARWSCN